MYTQPMLEIYADDVKCAHGSTVGQLNDAALFYMQQRGISKKEARLLLQLAFINEVIDTRSGSGRRETASASATRLLPFASGQEEIDEPTPLHRTDARTDGKAGPYNQ